MKKKYRLLKKSDFQKTLKNCKKKYFSNFFILYSYKNLDQNIRIGIILPKKFFKKAVQRNYYKRVIYNCIYQTQNIKELPKLNCVIYCKKNLLNDQINFKNIQSEIIKIFKILKNKKNELLSTNL